MPVDYILVDGCPLVSSNTECLLLALFYGRRIVQTALNHHYRTPMHVSSVQDIFLLKPAILS